jgi:hypothetical protein
MTVRERLPFQSVQVVVAVVLLGSHCFIHTKGSARLVRFRTSGTTSVVVCIVLGSGGHANRTSGTCQLFQVGL